MQVPTAAADASERRLLRRWALAKAILLTSFTALVLVSALAVTMPASALATLVTPPPQVETLSGSAWRGRAGLAGGHVVDWTVSLREIWLGRVLADATLDGPDTRLTGTLSVSPWQVTTRSWTGRAGSSLLALLPGVSVPSCTTRAMVAIEQIGLGRRAASAEGEVRVPEGTCTDRAGRELSVPALVLDLFTDGRDARAALSLEDGTSLASAGVTGDRRLLLRIEPEGAAMVPGLPSAGPTILEIPF